MRKTSELINLMNKCEIEFSIDCLPEHILGYYQFDGEGDYILINKSIESTPALFRTVLAEEIGHYFTTIGQNEPKRYMCSRDRISIDKCEEAALRWACNFLLPTDSLISLMNNL